MSFDRFKRFRPTGEVEEPRITNPYAKKSPTKSVGDFDETEGGKGDKSILESQNKHLYSLVNTQAREIKELKEDIATLYSMLMGDDSEEAISDIDAKDRYMIFKTDKRHLLNRKVKAKIFNGDGER